MEIKSIAHQAVDKKYYKRFNFLSEPMHDYEIKDIMNRDKHPKIELRFEVHHKVTYNDLRGFGGVVITSHFYNLKIFAKNSGKVLANYVYCDISLPENCLQDKYRRGQGQDLITVKINNLTNDDYLKYHPILPNLEIELKLDNSELHEYYLDNGNYLRWTVYADNSNPISGEISFREIKLKRVSS